MVTYEQALQATAFLLDLVGETYWRNCLEGDARRWRELGDVTHHLAQYGGMGSWNDVWICQANGYRVTDEQEPWVNQILDWLRSLCWYLAINPAHAVTAAEIDRTLGRLDSSLDAFANVTDETRIELREKTRYHDRQLQGWRCLACGLSRVIPRDVEWFLSAQFVPRLLANPDKESNLKGVVSTVLEMRVPGVSDARDRLQDAVTRSGITLEATNDWLRVCPRCGSNRTVVYRWNVVSHEETRLVPAKNNLPLAM